MLIAILRISPAARDIHTPSISKKRGSTSTGTTIKRMVRQKERMAEVLPSLRAVNQPEAKIL